MKTQKRSQSDRALAKGYQAGATGKSWSKCPFDGGDARENWMAGWREGREDSWNGFGPAAQAQRLSNM
jgi:ribosome modulation factor